MSITFKEYKMVIGILAAAMPLASHGYVEKMVLTSLFEELGTRVDPCSSFERTAHNALAQRDAMVKEGVSEEDAFIKMMRGRATQ